MTLFDDLRLLRAIHDSILNARGELKDGRESFVITLTASEHAIVHMKLQDLIHRMMDQTT